MRPRFAFHVAPIELVQTLKRDGTTFFSAEPVSDFLPRLALLALCADEINEWFQATTIRSPAAFSTSPIFGFRIHLRTTYGGNAVKR
jgi:hypothetical protein